MDHPYKRQTEIALEKAKKLVAIMSLEECASQLLFNSRSIEALEVPAYNWWNEALHGVARAGMATLFPQPIALAASFNRQLLYEIGCAVAEEARAKYNAFSSIGDRGIYKGLTFYTPNINIFRDPRWGRGQETYGEDPCLTKTLAIAFVKGLQGDDTTYLKAAACAKHFLAHSGPETNRHSFDAKVSAKDLEETYLPAFKALVEAGVEGVMGAYNRINGVPCCGSKQYITELLRNTWKFEGYITSDCWAIADFHLHHKVTENALQSTALAINSGCDLNCGNMYQYLLQAYEEKLVSEEQIRNSAIRVLTTRFKLGLFEKHTVFDTIGYSAIDCPEHQKLNLSASQQSLVLLKNKSEILPLDATKNLTIAVIGPNANSIDALEGNYHGTANTYYTVLEGVQNVFSNARVLYSPGCHLYDNALGNKDQRSEVILHTRASDLVILVVGLDESIESEDKEDSKLTYGGDKPDLLLPKTQRELIETVMAEQKPTVIICLSGSSIDLLTGNDADAIIQGWYPGALGGLAIAELLSGAYNPSGKLPVTFYSHKNHLPDYEDYSMVDRTYRFMKEKPLYSFGFGLSYSRFVFQSLVLDSKTLKAGDALKGSFTCKNEGPFSGRVVIQYYLVHDSTQKRNLTHFHQISLECKEQKIVQFSIDPEALTIVDDAAHRTYGLGKWTLYAGCFQPDARTKELLGDYFEYAIVSDTCMLI